MPQPNIHEAWYSFANLDFLDFLIIGPFLLFLLWVTAHFLELLSKKGWLPKSGTQTDSFLIRHLKTAFSWFVSLTALAVTLAILMVVTGPVVGGAMKVIHSRGLHASAQADADRHNVAEDLHKKVSQNLVQLISSNDLSRVNYILLTSNTLKLDASNPDDLIIIKFINEQRLNKNIQTRVLAEKAWIHAVID